MLKRVGNQLFYEADGANGGSDGKPSGGSDGTKKAGEFDVNTIPSDIRQKLIDDGINIGYARGKEKAEKEGKTSVETFLKSKGVSQEDLDKFQELSSNSAAMQKILEHFGVDDAKTLTEKLEEDKRQKMTNEQKLQDDLKKAQLSSADKDNQIKALNDKFASDTKNLRAREEHLLGTIKKLVVDKRLTDLAVEKSAYDTEDILIRLGNSVKVEEVEGTFVPVVVNEKGEKRYNAEAKEFSLGELVDELLNKHPHLAKSSVKPGAGGSGSGSQKGSGGQENVSEKIKDPEYFANNYNAIINAAKNITRKK